MKKKGLFITMMSLLRQFMRKCRRLNTATWNFRVLRHVYVDKDGNQEEYFAVHEVHYENGNPVGCTKDPIDLGSENLKGLRWQLKKVKRGLGKPILDYDRFVDGEGYTE